MLTDSTMTMVCTPALHSTVNPCFTELCIPFVGIRNLIQFSENISVERIHLTLALCFLSSLASPFFSQALLCFPLGNFFESPLVFSQLVLLLTIVLRIFYFTTSEDNTYFTMFLCRFQHFKSYLTSSKFISDFSYCSGFNPILFLI